MGDPRVWGCQEHQHGEEELGSLLEMNSRLLKFAKSVYHVFLTLSFEVFVAVWQTADWQNVGTRATTGWGK